MANPIPEKWRSEVLYALKNGRGVIKDPPLQQFLASFLDEMPLPGTCFDALIVALSNSKLQGCKRQSTSGQGEIWEFLFVRKGIKMYGKIEMQLDGRAKVWSAHTDNSGGILSCD